MGIAHTSIGKMIGDKDGLPRAGSPLAASCACTVTSADLPMINAALLNVNHLRNSVLLQSGGLSEADPAQVGLLAALGTQGTGRGGRG